MEHSKRKDKPTRAAAAIVKTNNKLKSFEIYSNTSI
jgi:hypothetical protein